MYNKITTNKEITKENHKDNHTSPLFKKLAILPLDDINNSMLPSSFNDLILSTKQGCMFTNTTQDYRMLVQKGQNIKIYLFTSSFIYQC